MKYDELTGIKIIASFALILFGLFWACANVPFVADVLACAGPLAFVVALLFVGSIPN